jgi:hypothetical protein
MSTNTSFQNISKMQTAQGYGSAISMGIETVGNITTSAINHAMQMSAFEHQERMQSKAYDASLEAIKDESALVDDIKAINSNKVDLGIDLAETKKDKDVAEARYLEAKKTEKAMKKANKTLVKKALSDRRSRFYGKTV